MEPTIESILEPDPTPTADGGGSDSPVLRTEGASTDETLSEIEEELLAKFGVPPAPKQDPADPAPSKAQPAAGNDVIERIIQNRFGGDRAAAAAYLSENPGRLQAIEDRLQAMAAPVDPDAAEKALRAEIQHDRAIVECNSEIEKIEAEIKETSRQNQLTLTALAKAEREADRLDGKAEVASDDLKPNYLSQAASKRAEIASLNSEWKSNNRELVRAEKDKAHQERLLAARANEIQRSVSDRQNEEAAAMARVEATNGAFESALVATATDLKVKFTKQDLEFIRGKVTLEMRRDAGTRDWPLAKIQALTRDVVKDYATTTGKTRGARAVALSPRAPSAPRPASQRVANPTPSTAEQVAKANPAYHRERARMVEAEWAKRRAR